MIRFATIVGARPQFIKAATVSRVLRQADYVREAEEVLVHTGQHYDENMSKVFFDELDIPPPRYNLEISGGRHGEMTGRMLAAVEDVLLLERPDGVLVYGDTNSTLAGALAAAKLHIPVAHIEAGLRSFNMRMPEEINRIMADRLSSLLFCPTDTAVANLAHGGVTAGVYNVGDVMFDASLYYRDVARARGTAMQRLGVEAGKFALATCHRAENTDDPRRLEGILTGLGRVAAEMPVVLPLHPRTRQVVAMQGLDGHLGPLRVTDPLPFLDMVQLEQAARVIVTDSGGVEKEAFFYEVPCVTMRDETEWVETVEGGWNVLVGADADRIASGVLGAHPGRSGLTPYGEGRAAPETVRRLFERFAR